MKLWHRAAALGPLASGWLPSSNGRLEITPFMRDAGRRAQQHHAVAADAGVDRDHALDEVAGGVSQGAAVGVPRIVDRNPVTVHDDDAAGGIDQAVMSDRAGPGT